MACRACGLDHSPLVRCEIAAAINKTAINVAAINKAPRRAGVDRAGRDMAQNGRARHVYNAYMREYMRKRRAG